MSDIKVTVIAETECESTQIKKQLLDFFAPDTQVEIEILDTVSQSKDRDVLMTGSGEQTTCIVTGPRGHETGVIPVRYNLTKKGWQTIMKTAKFLRGARVVVTGFTTNNAEKLADTVRRLDIHGLEVEPVSVSVLHNCKFDFILVADPYSETITAQAERIIKLGSLLLSPSVIVDMLRRNNLYNYEAKAKMARYLEKVKLVREDYLDLLGIEYNKTQQVALPAHIEHRHKCKLCLGTKYTLDDIIGQSLPLKKAKVMVEQLKNSTSSIVLYGETGTGKELFAQAIHSLSPRRDSCFITVNCAAIPETLAESELFGYEGGAFTGAKKGGKTGLFEHAHGGTIFLDEISDMSMDIQARLLRVLEDGTLLRVGGRKLINVDVRVITACCKPLDEYVKTGHFREDLFYRLCVIPVYIPTLRERRGDIPLLVQHLFAEMGETRKLSPTAWEQLVSYHWPGNVRELKHCLEYMSIVTDNKMELDVFPPHIGQGKLPGVLSHSRTGELIQSFEQETTKTGFRRRTDEIEEQREPRQIASPANSLLDEENVFILEVIKHFNALGHGIGRRCLAHEARRYGIPLAEGETRNRLSFLRTMGYVKWGLGRSGAKLSSSGLQVLMEQPNRFNLSFPLN